MRKGMLCIALVALMFAGCTKDEIFPEKMTATVDGVTWSALTRVSTKYADKFIISGTTLNGDVLVITVFGSTPGTYTLAADSLQTQCSAAYTKKETKSTNDIIYGSSSGEVVLSEVDAAGKSISGTFHFNMRVTTNILSTLSITDGVFSDLKYTESTQQ